ncbi:uncharacterized protein BP5553_10321 [Venustampulla echinocandica]|uniref:glucan 1,3-beta-glucosidase n=1 Tax=Venustampulla echinocandica TaxID=2656787 RepID=A0A370T9X4_9HELO|nr:uncharacterized protein BP5553_10321 [Venustampulla echinocandica]RDL30443.1 hypothetical protein BP5553_10321 [Venustampulla echinocandica]
MNILALTPLLERFEAEYGTLTTLALFLGPLSTIPALIYTFIERVILRMNTTVLGASIWVFTLLAMEAMKTYRANPHFLLGSYKIPTWTTPLVMVIFVSVLIPNTSFLGHMCGLAFGYGWGLGYLKFLAPPEKILRWIEGKLNLLGRLPHYVSVDQKTYGRFGVLPTSSHASASAAENGIGMGLSRRLGHHGIANVPPYVIERYPHAFVSVVKIRELGNEYEYTNIQPPRITLCFKSWRSYGASDPGVRPRRRQRAPKASIIIPTLTYRYNTVNTVCVHIYWLSGPDGSVNAQRTLDIHDQLSQFFAQDRYRNIVVFYGLLNEPTLTPSQSKLISWTQAAYKIVHDNGVGAIQVFSESMRGLSPWQGKLTGYGDSLAIDVHEYTIFDDVVGEWSQADTDCAESLNGVSTGSRWEGTFSGSSSPHCPTKDQRKRKYYRLFQWFFALLSVHTDHAVLNNNTEQEPLDSEADNDEKNDSAANGRDGNTMYDSENDEEEDVNDYDNNGYISEEEADESERDDESMDENSQASHDTVIDATKTADVTMKLEETAPPTYQDI